MERTHLYLALSFTTQLFLSALLGAFLFALFPIVVSADEGCGSIVEIEHEIEYATPIEDCSNPFNADDISVYKVTVELNENPIEHIGSTVALDPEQIYTFSLEAENTPFRRNLILYKHVEDGYLLEGYGYSHTFMPGTYTLVVLSDSIPILSQRNWWSNILEWIVPSAIAYFPDYSDVQTFTFTVEELLPDITGPSSILFLPGIQASRLYKEKLLFGEDQLWEPNFIFDADTKKLAMDDSGNSIEDVYTRDILSYIGDNTSKPVYGGFVQFLQDMVDEDVISEYRTFAYDWRYDVNDIVTDGTKYENEVKHLNQEIEDLAANSKSGKVTLVAHSNGGMLGKALISQLADTDKDSLVDDFVMIGTPQLGTPKAIGSLLHGLDQGINILNNFIPVVSEKTARFVSANMPGAYGLLPGEEYLSLAGEPVIEFVLGAATEAFINEYGIELESESSLDAFLRDDAGARGEANKLNEAIVLKSSLLAKARQTRALQDTWNAPPEIDVYSVAGTGRNTVRGFRYEPISEFVCVGASLCTEKLEYKPIPLISTAGDQTVMTLSALGSAVLEQTNFLVDLKLIERATAKNYIHYNMTESQSVQNIISSIVNGTELSDEFVSRVGSSQSATQNLLGTHSPVFLYIEDTVGRKTGQLSENNWVEEIPNTEFLSLGGSSYIIAPKDLVYTVYISAYDFGGVTITLHDLENSNQPLINKIPVSYITSSTTITIEYMNDILGSLQVDENGDTVIDYEVASDGTIIIPNEEKVVATSTTNLSSANATRTNRNSVTGLVAGLATSTLWDIENMTRVQLLDLLTQIKNRLLDLLKINS